MEDMSSKEARASNLLMQLKSVDFYVSLVFMKNILYKMKVVPLEMQEIRNDALNAVESLKLTNIELRRIRNYENEVNDLLSVAERNARNKGVDVYYEFEKNNRSKLYRHLVGRQGDTRTDSIKKQLMFHYRSEMYTV